MCESICESISDGDNSRDDWQLYDLPGREDAAIALNRRFEVLVNKGATRNEVRNGMCLSDCANLGAAGTEARIFPRRPFGQDIR